MKFLVGNEFGVEFKYNILHGKRYMVFNSRADFEQYFINGYGSVPPIADNWRKAQTDDWICADDGGVLQILRNKNGFVRTIVGTYSPRTTKFLDSDFNLRINRYVLTANSETSRYKNISKRKIMTPKETFFAILVMTGKEPMEAYCIAFNYDGKYANKYAQLILKQERTRKYMNELVINAAKKCGVDEEWVIKAIKKIAEAGDIKTSDKLNAITKLGQYVGMEDKKEELPHNPIGGFLAGIKSESRFLESIERKELPGEIPPDVEIPELNTGE